MGEASILSNNFIIMSYILQKVAVFIGIALTFSGIMQFKKYGEQRSMMSSQMSAAGPALLVICGAALMILPSVIGAALISVWGSNSPLSYEGGPTGYSSLVPAIVILVRVVGVGSFIRGIVMLSKTGGQQSQPGTTGKAFMHILAGVMCIHILGTVGVVENMLGLD